MNLLIQVQSCVSLILAARKVDKILKERLDSGTCLRSSSARSKVLLSVGKRVRSAPMAKVARSAGSKSRRTASPAASRRAAAPSRAPSRLRKQNLATVQQEGPMQGKPYLDLAFNADWEVLQVASMCGCHSSAWRHQNADVGETGARQKRLCRTRGPVEI